MLVRAFLRLYSLTYNSDKKMIGIVVSRRAISPGFQAYVAAVERVLDRPLANYLERARAKNCYSIDLEPESCATLLRRGSKPRKHKHGKGKQ